MLTSLGPGTRLVTCALAFALAMGGCGRRRAAQGSAGAPGEADRTLNEKAHQPAGDASAEAREVATDAPADRLDAPPSLTARHGTYADPSYHALLSSARSEIESAFPNIDAHDLDIDVTTADEGRHIGLVRGPPVVGVHAPVLVSVDARGRYEWLNPRALAGLGRPATVALGGGPRGDVLAAFCEPSSRVIGARRWDATGGLLVDFQIASVETCGALEVVSWPGRGWVFVYDANGRPRAQRLSDSGQLLWGANGRSLVAEEASPVTYALDSDDSLVVVSVLADAAHAGRARLAAVRIDDRANPFWESPITLFDAAGDRPNALQLERVGPGVLRATLGESTVFLASDGRVTLAR